MASENFPVVDGHNDTVLWHFIHFGGFAKESTKGQMDFPRLRKGNVEAGVFSLCNGRHPLLLKLFTKIWFSMVNNKQNGLYQVLEVDDIGSALHKDEVGAILGFEDASGIDSNLELLDTYHEKGLKVVGITWNNANKFATGVRTKPPQRDGGLTDLGKDFIKKTEKIGITLDVSHFNDSTFFDFVEVVQKPFIASHSNARSICPHPRNLTKEQIKVIGEKKGVIGVNFGWKFLDPDYEVGRKYTKEEIGHKKEQVGFDVIKQHLDRIVEIAGIDAVGLGADYDGTSVPDCVKDCSKLPDLFIYLSENGYSKQELMKISHENFKRVFSQTW